jgi:hypothetical protein
MRARRRELAPSRNALGHQTSKRTLIAAHRLSGVCYARHTTPMPSFPAGEGVDRSLTTVPTTGLVLRMVASVKPFQP